MTDPSSNTVHVENDSVDSHQDEGIAAAAAAVEDDDDGEEKDEDEEWEDVSEIDPEDVIELAEQNNALLHATLGHPKINVDTPSSSPAPLWSVANYVRTTYLNYAIPLLPQNAQFLSPRVANPFVFDYTGRSFPGPDKTEPLAVDYLRGSSTIWPDLQSDSSKQLFKLLEQRSIDIAEEILAKKEDPQVVFGKGTAFDFDEPIAIREIALMMLGDEETLRRIRRQEGDLSEDGEDDDENDDSNDSDDNDDDDDDSNVK